MWIEYIKSIILIMLVITLTHALFFIAYGILMGGDPFIALDNFYRNMYYGRW